MLAESMLNFRRTLEEEGVILCYSGIVTEAVLLSVGNSLKSKLAVDKTDKQVARSLFAVFVEQVQNVIRYSVERVERDVDGEKMALTHGLVTVGKQDNKYFVACANLVEKKDVQRIGDELHHIQSLDKESLKALYKRKLKAEAPDESKGAGVGFIDIARKATQGFDFGFHDYDMDHVFFAIKAYI